MTNNLDLDKLERLHTAATPGEWQIHGSHLYGPDPERVLIGQTQDWPRNSLACIAALHNAFPVLADEIKRLRGENAELKGRAEEAEETAETAKNMCIAEWEGDCAAALRSIADECGFEWEPDGVTADCLREHISATLDECDRIRESSTTRDERMKREGAAYELDRLLRQFDVWEWQGEIRRRLAEVRRGGE